MLVRHCCTSEPVLGQLVRSTFAKRKLNALWVSVFDQSGNFLLYGTMLGVKVVNLVTNRVALWLGKAENIRFLQLALCQGAETAAAGDATTEMTASSNPLLAAKPHDPTMFCTAFKKNRVYLFSRREPAGTDESGESGGESRHRDDRKPTSGP